MTASPTPARSAIDELLAKDPYPMDYWDTLVDIARQLQRELAVARSETTFRPTHRHAEGGLYEVVGTFLKIHTAKDTWETGVRYRNAEGMEFARTVLDFDERFTQI